VLIAAAGEVTLDRVVNLAADDHSTCDLIGCSFLPPILRIEASERRLWCCVGQKFGTLEVSRTNGETC
jgi:hypothetical protein